MKYYEDEYTELKEKYVEDIKKEIVAFANTKGGKVIIGVNDKGEVVGVNDCKNLILTISNSIRDSIKPDITQFVDINVEKDNDKDLIIIDIQRGSNRPYYLANKGLKPSGVYIRQATSSFPASELRIKELIKDSDNYVYEDSYSFNQNLTFDYTKKIFTNKNVSLNKSNMKSLGIINNEGSYTNLGLLISDQCPHIIKAAKFLDDEFTFNDRQEFSGSIFKQLDDAYHYLELCNSTRSTFEGLYRKDSVDYPAVALRESLLNAIIHRDYSSSGATLIKIFNNRINIVNAGSLNEDVTLDDVMAGYSLLRNPKLANIFYRLELIEAYGTGISKILKSYENKKDKPKFETTDHLFLVTLPNNNSIKEIDNVVKDDSLLQFIKEYDTVSRNDLEKQGTDSASTVVRKLRKLKDEGYIEVIGKGKNTKYKFKG